MNIKFNISIKPNMIKKADGQDYKSTRHGEYSLLLSPFYAIEQDIIRVFMEDSDKYFDFVRQSIFEASIKADKIFNKKFISQFDFSDIDAFSIKRDYVICSVTYQLGNTLHKDYLKSIKKQKFLADLKVSLEIEKDPKMLNNIIEDAKACMTDLENLVTGFGFNTFVKGQNNSCNKESTRQWYPSLPNNEPRVPLAASKFSTFCTKYKIGQNAY